MCRIDDAWSSRYPDPECYTDGVGVITTEGMRQAVQQHPGLHRAYVETKRLPSAIQVRLGGAKGMLTRWDNWCAPP